MNIFITGICGFVGSRIAKHIKSTHPDYEIFGLDNCSRSGSWTNLEPLQELGITIYRGDIRVASDLRNSLTVLITLMALLPKTTSIAPVAPFDPMTT